MKRAFFIILLLVLAFSSLGFLLPVHYGDVFNTHVSWAYSLLVGSLFFAAAMLSLLSLSSPLGKMLGIVALGLVVLAVGQLQNPANDIFNLWNSPWVSYGGYNIVFLVADVLIIVGLVLTGHIFNVEYNDFLGPSVIIGIIGITAILFIPVYNAQSKLDQLVDIPHFTLGVLTILSLLMILVSYQLWHALQPAQRLPRTIFLILLVANIGIFFGNAFTMYFQYTSWNNWLVNSGIYRIPYLVAGFSYVFFALKLRYYKSVKARSK